MDVTAAPERPRRAWVAALLSIVQPGLGHLYVGEWKRALVLWLGGPAIFLVAFLARLARTFAGLTVVLAAALLYLALTALDAVRLARARQHYALRRFNRWYWYGLVLLVLALVPREPLLAWLPVRSFKVPAASMEPTIRVGDRLFADMTCWQKEAPKRGDLVLFWSMERPDTSLIKRVIATGGEKVEIRNKRVFINGQPLTDDWGQHSDPRTFPPGIGAAGRRDNFGPVEVPPGTVFVLGDNRDLSYDSRFFGPVPQSFLRGRPLYLYWARDWSRIGADLR